MAGVRRGVLRKKKSEEETGKLDDLLVFGYACKLFRDDEKALYIDQGKHLIPWMGDENLKIDRYDARGALYDLKPFEYKSGSFGRFDGLTAEEKQVEELCDHERYFALYKDEREEALYQEEEMKRLQLELNEVTSAEATYHQVPFSYSGQENEKMSENQPSENAQKSVQGEIGDAVFVPPPEMDIPPDILVPPTVKLALIIQKTAQFITAQGTQMEIVLKAKQANNPMFEFLNFDSALQPYYKFVCTAIRNGTYVPVEEPAEEVKPETTEEKQKTDSEDSDNDSYLHPSLQPKTIVTTPPEETGSTEVTPFVHPPPDVQPIVDKTASYITRNGRHLESVIRSKGDPRFTFLQPDHAYHAYYLHKLTVYSEMLGTKADQKHEAKEPKEEISAVPEDPEEKLKSERRMKAAAFLDQIKKKISMTIRPASAVVEGTSPAEREAVREAEEIASLTTRSRTNSSDGVEVIGSVPKRRSRRSESRSPSRRRRRHRSRTQSPSRSRSKSQTRSRSRDRSLERRRRRHRHRDRSREKSRRGGSREKSRREKRKRRSRDREEKRNRHKKKSRHRYRSPSSSSSRSRSRSTLRSRLSTGSPSPARSASPKAFSSSIAEPKVGFSIPSAEVSQSSPLPPELQPVQPALAKIAEGLRAKVLAMFDEDPK